ncbi:putative mitochondrial protein, partial [Mucuna pruriens]
MLLFQEFNIEIRDKKGAENLVADHLSQIERENEFPDEQLLHIITSIPWFANICNFVATSQFPLEASRLYKERLKSDAKYYIWDDPYLWRLCNDQVIRRCILDADINSVFQFCHAALGGGYYGSTRTTKKVLDCGFYWSTIFRDAYQFVSTYDKCQKEGMTISRRHEMPQQPILFCEVFDVWGIDFMGPFPVSNVYSYILLIVDYVSRWNALWACRTTYRNPLRMSPYWIVFGKACHLLVEIEHRAYWAVKQCNLAYDQVGQQSKLLLQELDELRLEAYENLDES